MKRILLAILLLLLFPILAYSQSAIIRGEISPGVYSNIAIDESSRLISVAILPVPVDPCASSAIAKSSIAFNITTATTTALVAPSGATVIYVCGFTFTISQVITTANTLKFIEGTGAACVTGPANLTGTFGAGGITAGSPLPVNSMSGSGTTVKTAAGGGLCATTTIGATAFFNGVLTYVQQ